MNRYLIIIASLVVLTIAVGMYAAVSRESPEAQCAQMTKDPRSAQNRFSGLELSAIKSKRAIKVCSLAMRSNPKNPQIIYSLARAYDSKNDTNNALKYYEMAAEQGVHLAYASMGDIHWLGRNGTRDLNTGLLYYRWAAKHGEPAGLTALGYLGFFGETPHVTPGNAVVFLKDAVKLGDPLAMALLGMSFHLGFGQEPNLALAKHWYERAAGAAGAAGAGSAAASFILAIMLISESSDYDKIPDDAMRLLTKAAEGGDVNAQEFFARSYLMGDGVERNLAKAAFWSWKAIVQRLSEL